ncbi:MAG: ATP-binding protein [Daejeonella sp.]|uniref:ATP-binding protein n=1 Tax=Daejeonella sp. TaxID=2805397 RepID=UPI0027365DC0|nr:ATP-binding protein [Daejeonella sp.]MDP3469415.1 ATP-binding protein [Daejeonella sp.]
MPEQPNNFNWSLKNLLSTIPDSLEQSRVKILYTFLILSILKVLIVIPIAYQNNQVPQLKLAFILLIGYVLLTKLLLSHKRYAVLISHIMIIAGLMIVIIVLFGYAKTINIMAMQFMFMVILSGFYLLNRGFGIFYSILSIIPVILFLFKNGDLQNLNNSPEGLSSPAYEIMVFLNFITMVLGHYLFHQAFSRNVKEKELLNEKLLIAVEEANIAAQSKSDFLSTMSHELRTPLNSVIGMAELLSDELTSPEQEENLKILNFSAASLHTLINDILDFNKLGSEKLYLESIAVNLHSLIHNICSGLRIQAREKGLELVLELDEELKQIPISTDPTRISQILFNLTGNAIKFTSSGSVKIQVEVLDKDADKISVRFSISDTGIGINAEKMESIFEPFTQASTSTTRNYGGTGLGLAIVKRLLTLFESSVHLESEEGKGSKFWFDISFKRYNQALDNDTNSNEQIYDLKGLRVLVVEDNPVNSLLLKKIFQKWSNIPDFARDGYEALDKVIANEYDLVLMDIHMPLLDGYEATLKIRELSDKEKSLVPIIALTASVSSNLNDKIREAGMNDYLSKPYNPKELYSKLREIALRKK